MEMRSKNSRAEAVTLTVSKGRATERVGGKKQDSKLAQAAGLVRPANARGSKNLLTEAQRADLVRRRAAGETLASLAAAFGLSLAGVGAVYRKATGSKPRRWGGRRTFKCGYCAVPIPVGAGPMRSICGPCSDRVCAPLYDRDKGIGAIPETLRRRYSLSG
jgi:hypothetical protein